MKIHARIAADTKQGVVVDDKPGASGFIAEPLVSMPEELAKFQAVESQKWGRIIKAAAIQPE